jgi:uncharacterized protein YukE
MLNEVSNVGYWWKGEAANTFLYKYNDIDRDIQNLKKGLDDLRYYANRLAKLLEEEERESKRISNNFNW